jgi:hypothetical protein
MEDETLKEQETLGLTDAGAVVEQTKGEIRGRWVDDSPPYPSTRT